ncbi:MAG: hypothetical protein JWN76_2469 [Chitinophagaceae bacterium]|nr:hypothetical protein [Chitinophagaceae bacterium]
MDLDPVFRKLVVAYQHSSLNLNSSYEEQHEKAEKFVAGLEDSEKNHLLSEGAINIVELSFSDELSPEEKFYYTIAFRNFYETVVNVIAGYQPAFQDFEGFERQASPPLEAYQYIGHNKLQIKEGVRSYSLLFE